MDRIKKRHLYMQGLIAFIFLYILSAIIWWYWELNHQNDEMFALAMKCKEKQDAGQILQLTDKYERNHFKFLLEGITFVFFNFLAWAGVAWFNFRQYQLTHQQHYYLELLAHEIKTPLTICHLQLQFFEKTKRSKKEKEIFTTTISQLKQIDSVVNKFLTLLRFESHHKKGKLFEQVAVEKIILESIRRTNAIYPDKSKFIFFPESNKAHLVDVDVSLMQIVFSNIINNALQHAAIKSKLQIDVVSKDKNIFISFYDDGSGVNEGMVKTYFKKRNITTSSISSRSGFGLRICYLICRYHHGNIFYEKQPLGGKFVVSLPKL